MAGMTYALGRFLLAIVFVVSGYQKFMAIAGVAKTLAARNVPVPIRFETWIGLPRYEVVGYAIALIEVLGGVMVLIGFKARFAACLLFVLAFGMLFVTFDLLTLEGLMRAVQRQALMHLSVMGGLMLIAAAGAGPWSFDGRSRSG